MARLETPCAILPVHGNALISYAEPKKEKPKVSGSARLLLINGENVWAESSGDDGGAHSLELAGTSLKKTAGKFQVVWDWQSSGDVQAHLVVSDTSDHITRTGRDITIQRSDHQVVGESVQVDALPLGGILKAGQIAEVQVKVTANRAMEQSASARQLAFRM